MSEKRDNNTIQVADLEVAITDIEKNLDRPNKLILGKIMEGFVQLSILLDRKEPGIFSSVIKWFRLYLRLQISIDPRNNKLLQKFEQSIPAAITYIICCLQYRISNNVSDYHYNLLDMLDTLLQNSPPKVMEQFVNFEPGTISCIWKPISFVGDYCTQLLALKLFARILNSLDAERQEGELKTIKWTNLNLFKDNLKKVIEKTHQIYAFENACRDLLNNYNMNLSRKLLVYSFHCNSVLVANKYEFFKPLFFEKFWVDMNFCPHTISFKCRHKANTKSLKLEDFNVLFTWKMFKLERDYFIINIDKTKTNNLPDDALSKLNNHDEIKICLPQTEIKRIMENEHFMEHLKKINSDNNEVKISNVIITGPTCSGTPFGNSKVNSLSSLRQGRKRKFFNCNENEENNKLKKQPNKEAKKKAPVKTPRILKPRNTRKSVCAVVPMVDLTKSPETNRKNSNVPKSKTSNTITRALHDNEKMGLNEEQCTAILNEVNSICHRGAIYDKLHSEEPCQSYQNYKMQRAFCLPSKRDTKENVKEESVISKTIQNHSDVISIPEENNNDETPKRILKYNTRKRKIDSQDLFDNMKSDDENKTPDRKQKNKNYSIDLAQNVKENVSAPDDINSMEGDCEEIRSPISLPKTPTSTTTMNVSDTNNTPNLSHTTYIMDHFLWKKFRTDDGGSQFGRQQINTNVVRKSINNNSYQNETQFNIRDINCDKPCIKVCVIYQNRLSDDSDSDYDESVQNNHVNNKRGLSIISVQTSNEVKSSITGHQMQKDVMEKNTRMPSDDHNSVTLANVTISSKTSAYPSKPPIMLMSRKQFTIGETLVITQKKANFVNKMLLNKNFKNIFIQKIADDMKQHEIVPFKPITELSREESNVIELVKSHDINNYLQFSENGRNRLARAQQVEFHKSTILSSCQPNSSIFKSSTKSVLISNYSEVFALNPNTRSTPSLKLVTHNKNNDFGDTSTISNTDVKQIGCKPLELCTNFMGETSSKKALNDDDVFSNNDNKANFQQYENGDILKNDLSHLIYEYKSKLNNKKVENLRRKCLTNSFEILKEKVCEITESILKESKEQRRELERIQFTIEMLVRQMESLYQTYVQKSKEYESFQEKSQHSLDILAGLNLNMQTEITNEYKAFKTQFTILEKCIRQEAWEKYLKIQKQDILKKIDELYAI